MNINDAEVFSMREKAQQLEESLASMEGHRAMLEEYGIDEEEDLDFRIEQTRDALDEIRCASY